MREEITPYQLEVYGKYLGNMRLGFRTLSIGKVAPFIGYPADRSNGTTLRAFYAEETKRDLANRLITPIEDLALENGIGIYSASLWTPHTTISELMYIPGITPTSREAVFEKVLVDSRVNEVIQNLQALLITFDILWGGDAIAIAASCIPIQILEARRQMTQVAKDLGMGEKDFTNIFHITLARMTPYPTRSADFYPFVRGLIRLQHEVFRDPIKAQIIRAEVMSNQQMDEVHEAKLIAAALNS